MALDFFKIERLNVYQCMALVDRLQPGDAMDVDTSFFMVIARSNSKSLLFGEPRDSDIRNEICSLEAIHEVRVIENPATGMFTIVKEKKAGPHIQRDADWQSRSAEDIAAGPMKSIRQKILDDMAVLLAEQDNNQEVR